MKGQRNMPRDARNIDNRSITLLPHQGFLIRTQPNSKLQVTRVGEFILSLGAKKVFTMIPQTPFTQSTFDILNQVLPKGGATHQSLIYDDKKTTYRTEVDQALRASPDVILANGYTPDTTILLKDLYRAGFKGKILGFAYSINQKLLDQIGQPEVVEGVYTFAPSPAEGSGAYERVKAAVGSVNPDPYTCQVYDHINMVLMSMALAKDASGVAIKDNIRKVTQGGGKSVDNAADGIKAIAAGEKVDYAGASGPCDFDDKGDILDCKFRYEQIKSGKFTVVKAGKIATREDKGTLLAELIPTPKVLAELRQWFPKGRLVGWKYEVDGKRPAVLRKAEKQIAECLTDACVANGPAYGDGFGLVKSEGETKHLGDKRALFKTLDEFIRE